MTMTGVDRVIKALKRDEPDTVPHFELIHDPKVRDAILPGASYEDFVEHMDLDGYVLIINFWATWCPPCRAEMPDIESVYQDYRDKDVVIIGVDLGETMESVRQFVSEGGYNWTFVMDTIGEVAAAYEVSLIPTSYFLDASGIIRAKSVGAITRRTMEAGLTEAMR